MSENKVDYSSRMRALREEKSKTQSEVAIAIGAKTSTLRMWELGISKPGIESIINLADYFGVSIDYLLGRSPERGPAKMSYFQLESIFPENRGRLDELINKIVVGLNMLSSSPFEQSQVLSFYWYFTYVIENVFARPEELGHISPKDMSAADVALLLNEIDRVWFELIKKDLVEAVAEKYIRPYVFGEQNHG